MSNYLYDHIEEIMKENDIKSIENNSKDIFESLKFISTTLLDFHNILNVKTKLINNKITKEEYNKKYHEYRLKFRKTREKFYRLIHDKNKDKISKKDKEIIKKIWSMELV